jgi:hypothetical protein
LRLLSLKPALHLIGRKERQSQSMTPGLPLVKHVGRFQTTVQQRDPVLDAKGFEPHSRLAEKDLTRSRAAERRPLYHPWFGLQVRQEQNAQRRFAGAAFMMEEYNCATPAASSSAWAAA